MELLLSFTSENIFQYVFELRLKEFEKQFVEAYKLPGNWRTIGRTGASVEIGPGNRLEPDAVIKNEEGIKLYVELESTVNSYTFLQVSRYTYEAMKQALKQTEKLDVIRMIRTLVFSVHVDRRVAEPFDCAMPRLKALHVSEGDLDQFLIRVKEDSHRGFFWYQKLSQNWDRLEFCRLTRG